MARWCGCRLGVPGGVRLAGQAFSRFERLTGADPRAIEPRATIGLLEDVPLLLVHGGADQLIPAEAAAFLDARVEGSADQG